MGLKETIAKKRTLKQLEGNSPALLQAIFGEVKLLKGDIGPSPEDEHLISLIKPLIPEPIPGHTPTDVELLELIKPLIPEIKDGITPSDEQLLALIRPLIPVAEKGDPGKDGKTPSDAKLLTLIKPLIPAPLKLETANAVVEKINRSTKKIKLSQIEDLDKELGRVSKDIRSISRQKGSNKMIHGGGMTLVAGSNVTLVRNTNGTWTVAASSGGSSSIATEKLTAVQNGSDVTLDLTGLAHTFVSLLFVTRDGQVLMPNGSAGFPGSSWSVSGSVVTVYNADAGNIYLVQYTF